MIARAVRLRQSVRVAGKDVPAVGIAAQCFDATEHSGGRALGLARRHADDDPIIGRPYRTVDFGGHERHRRRDPVAAHGPPAEVCRRGRHPPGPQQGEVLGLGQRVRGVGVILERECHRPAGLVSHRWSVRSMSKWSQGWP
jgi:hypothetical protein